MGYGNKGHAQESDALRGDLEMGNSYIVKTLDPCSQGHSSFITHLDWSKDGNFIMSNSGDYEILYCE